MASNFTCVLFWPQTFASMQNFNFNIVKGLCDIWLQCAKSFQNPKLSWSCKTKLQLCQQNYTSKIRNETNFSCGTMCDISAQIKKLFLLSKVFIMYSIWSLINVSNTQIIIQLDYKMYSYSWYILFSKPVFLNPFV